MTSGPWASGQQFSYDRAGHGHGGAQGIRQADPLLQAGRLSPDDVGRRQCAAQRWQSGQCGNRVHAVRVGAVGGGDVVRITGDRVDPAPTAAVKGSLRMMRVLRRLVNEPPQAVPLELRLTFKGHVLVLPPATLRQIRKEQVSFDREEYLVGVVCMAVPVIGSNGELLAALAIQAPAARMNVQTARRHLPALRQAAEELAGIFQDRP